MNEIDYKEFEKRYAKFKKNNLPTPFWDDDRHTLEYVYFQNGVDNQSVISVNSSLTESLGDIAYAGFYYPFLSKGIFYEESNGEVITEEIVDRYHSHSFEGVVQYLYDYPETFSIKKEDEEFYSKQELNYLRRLQKYLLFIGLKDLENGEVPEDRYNNKLQEKFSSSHIYKLKDSVIKRIIDGKQDFLFWDWYPEYNVNEESKYCVLVTDLEDNFKLYIEFTHIEVKEYKDIKDIVHEDSLKDNEKVIVRYFKILELFDNKNNS